jgi:hypothetical protein
MRVVYSGSFGLLEIPSVPVNHGLGALARTSCARR